jgi:hypothetical protein
MRIDLADLERKLAQLEPGNGPPDPRPMAKDLLESTLPGFERDLREQLKSLDAMPPALRAAQSAAPLAGPTKEIMSGMQKYTKITAAILAIYAVPHDLGPLAGNDPAQRAKYESRDEETTGAQAKAFENGLPAAKVVRIPHADHYVFRSNEADVLKEMNAFIAGLK